MCTKATRELLDFFSDTNKTLYWAHLSRRQRDAAEELVRQGKLLARTGAWTGNRYYVLPPPPLTNKQFRNEIASALAKAYGPTKETKLLLGHLDRLIASVPK